MESKQDIYSFWVHYTTKVSVQKILNRANICRGWLWSSSFLPCFIKNEEVYFRKFISRLVAIWENQLDLDWSSDESLAAPTQIKPDTGPPLSRLPEELLPAIGKFLYVTKDKMDKVW